MTKLEPGDYYMEGPLMVFTEAFHRKRGYCCENRCRHCPFRGGKSDRPVVAAPHSCSTLVSPSAIDSEH